MKNSLFRLPENMPTQARNTFRIGLLAALGLTAVFLQRLFTSNAVSVFDITANIVNIMVVLSIRTAVRRVEAIEL